MISKNDIIKMARQVFHHSAGRRRVNPMDPVRDWYIGLTVFVLVAGSGSLWVWTQFNFYKALDPAGGEVQLELATYHAVAAEAAVEHFREKQQVYDELVNAPPLTELPKATASGSNGAETEEVPAGGATSTSTAVENEAAGSAGAGASDSETTVDLTQPLIGGE